MWRCSSKLAIALIFSALYIIFMIYMSSSLVSQIIADQGNEKQYEESNYNTDKGATSKGIIDLNGGGNVKVMKDEIVVVTRLFLPFSISENGNAINKKVEIQNEQRNLAKEDQERKQHTHEAGYEDKDVTTKETDTGAAKVANHFPTLDEIVEFASKALEYSKTVIVCIDSFHDNKADSESELTDSYLWDYIVGLRTSLQQSADYKAYKGRIIVTPVTPWGRFTTALNVAIGVANDLGFTYICFQSFEFSASTGSVDALYRFLKYDPDGLVAGALLPGHTYLHNNNNNNNNLRGHRLSAPSSPVTANEVTISGTTCPWNTFALWRLKYLSLTGFQLVSDGVNGDLATGGVEEVVAISLLQQINPKLNAYLVNTGDIQWQTNFDADDIRAKYHKDKMRSKLERPQRQIERLGIPFGKVKHV